MSSQPNLPAQTGYKAAVAEEARSHDDIASRGTLTAAYRELVRDCLLMAPDLSGFTTFAELETECDITDDDLSLVRSAKALQTSTADEIKTALLTDVQAEWEIQNERKAQARDEDFYGSGSPQNERESLESYYGMGGMFK
jgi:hypothetical protein